MLELRNSVISIENIFSVSKGIVGYGNQPVVWLFQINVTYLVKKVFTTIVLEYGSDHDDRNKDFEKIKNLLLDK